jgi:alpha-galactosidase
VPVVKEHPEWFVDIGEIDLLLNLGDEKALKYLIDMTLSLFKKNHIDQLHQDFNMNALPYWEATDTPDRIGVTEIKYITGLYAYWDALRAHSPEILIDHCASGGRRIDIETLRRGYVFWRSDAQCWHDNDVVQNQIQNFYLNEWFPFHTGGVWVEPKARDEYNFFSSVSNGLSDCTFIYKHNVPNPKEFDYAYHASLVREAIRIQPYFLGNYYQLSRSPENLENWYAYQFHCAEKGMFMIFRRPEAPNKNEVFRLREIDPEAEYEIEIYGETEKTRISGKELRHYSITLPPRSFRLVYYTIVK